MKESLFEDEFILVDDPDCISLPVAKTVSASNRRKTMVVVAVASLFLVTSIALVQSSISYQRHHRTRVTYIAHMGNSFQFVNDFPRVLQSMATQPIVQDSVLHGSLSFITLPINGNGMRNRWRTETAWDSTLQLYDYGSCTIRQLLLGYDEYLFGQDYSAYYSNDGKNPCFAPEREVNTDDSTNTGDDDTAVDDDDDDSWQQDYDDSQAYLEYTLTSKTRSTWDFVVMNDQSIRPAIPYDRERSARSLNTTYIPMFLASQSTPILLATHAYWRKSINMTALGLYSVPHFTAKIYKGYQAYAKTLSTRAALKPRIAPVGLAFLTVWEENQDLWYRLFGPDYFHPSPHGTYLQACVVHTTIFGYLPDAPKSDATIEGYFANSRSMQLGKNPLDLPTKDEALYLRSIAQRVVLQNYLPPSFRKAYKLVKNDDGE